MYKVKNILKEFTFIKNLEKINIKISNDKSNFFDISIIYLFDISRKQSKDKNDYNNKIRENLIEMIINNGIPLSWYLFHHKWFLLKTKIEKYLLSLNSNIFYEKVECICKGGRNFNYDFDIKFYTNDYIIDKKVEFKYGCSKINDYPQFLSLSTKDNCSYSEYYYEKFLNLIPYIYNIEMISKEDFMKNIYGTNYESNLWFKTLYENDKISNQYKEKKDEIVKLSIHNFLIEHSYELDLEKFSDKFIQTQKDKHFMCYDGDFHYDYIEESELKIKNILDFKGGSEYINTLILETFSDTKIHMLLRWKNHNGILNPAWQISIKR